MAIETSLGYDVSLDEGMDGVIPMAIAQESPIIYIPRMFVHMFVHVDNFQWLIDFMKVRHKVTTSASNTLECLQDISRTSLLCQQPKRIAPAVLSCYETGNKIYSILAYLDPC
eukprot:10848553-Karenia_brevis.AAC.1